MEENPHDFPFAIFRTITQNKAVFSHATPLGEAAPLIASEYNLEEESEVTAIIKKTLSTGKPQVFEDLLKKVGELPRGAW